MADRKFHVISYDIVEDQKRTKAAETLKDYGKRVQKSVFECRLKDKNLEKLAARLEELIDKETDNILIYTLCEGCVPQKKFLGRKIIGEEEEGEEFRVL